MEVTAKIAAEIIAHEGIIREAYKDSVGVWTWSVGLTAATGHDVKRYIGKPATMEKCLEVFLWALENYAEEVRGELGNDFEEHEFGGALSFHWNTGAIRSASWPDLWKERKVSKARESFMSWTKPASLFKRREAEAKLFFDGVWSGDGKATEWTRLTPSYQPNWGSGQSFPVLAVLESMMDSSVGESDETGKLRNQLARIRLITEE